ncbi:MLL4 [Mytilus coruscus]|uniref:MLL4 n=1 Tax=Mytilus coruscus TaxID=42192 RepID=A0A6J8B1C8_MYTCO|nr:MLL4 [Mytilus coruscus]
MQSSTSEEVVEQPCRMSSSFYMMLKHKREAANRDIDIQATLKRGNLIIQFKSAAFLQFNTCFDQYFSSSQSLKLTVHERFDLSKKLSERSISFADINNPSKQLYRVNIFNTTCRIEVNGKQFMSFIDELSKITSQMSNDVDYKHFNTKIKEQCDILLSPINNDHNASVVVNKTKINPSKAVTNACSNDIKNPEECLKCKRKCLSRSVWCSRGNHWIHYHCEKLKSEMINILENNLDTNHYICSLCDFSKTIYKTFAYY